MAKLKKYPKKPKVKTIKSIENYMKRRKEVDKANSKIKSDKKKLEGLKNKLRNL